MKQLTVNIPESFMPEFIEYFSHIPNATIVNESDFVITPQMLADLDKSHDVPGTAYISREESNRILREKYGF